MIFNTMTGSASHRLEESSAKKQDHPDGSSIELPKRPRGRPPGSKNKPKAPIIITRDPDPQSTMRPYILEIPAGHDVLDSLLRFSRRKNLGLCVLGGTGSVANLTLRQPPHPTASGHAAAQATTVGFGGRFEVLSLSATVMPPASTAGTVTAAVTVAGPSGQVIGGTVVDPFLAAGTFTVVAAAFENPTFCRLPAAEEEDEMPARSASEEGNEQHQPEEEIKEPPPPPPPPPQQQCYISHREFQQQQHRGGGGVGGGESCGLIYSSHYPSDVIWAPTARPPHPPPY